MIHLHSSLVDRCLLMTACVSKTRLSFIMLAVKNLGKIFSYWFFNNMLHVKTDRNGSIFKIYHSCDPKNLLQVVNIDELTNNSSS